MLTSAAPQHSVHTLSMSVSAQGSQSELQLRFVAIVPALRCGSVQLASTAIGDDDDQTHHHKHRTLRDSRIAWQRSLSSERLHSGAVSTALSCRRRHRRNTVRRYACRLVFFCSLACLSSAHSRVDRLSSAHHSRIDRLSSAPHVSNDSLSHTRVSMDSLLPPRVLFGSHPCCVSIGCLPPLSCRSTVFRTLAC